MFRRTNTPLIVGLVVLIALGMAWGSSILAFGQGSHSLYLPLVFKPPPTLDKLVSQVALTLPASLGSEVSSWCTWGWCNISPRLYHEPLADGRTLVGWTDAGGNGHVSVIDAAGTGIETTYDFPARWLYGLTAHDNGQFAVLLWNAAANQMWLSKWAADGSQVWETHLDGPLTQFDPGIGDSRLGYGNGLYVAYFAVYGVSGWVQGHDGDQLTYVNDKGVIQSGGWEWGCSHSMAALVSYHPTLGQHLPVCSSDCYAAKGILLNDNQVVYAGDGNCGGRASAQLGQLALSANSWKLVFNAMSTASVSGKGIALATIDGSFKNSYLWLTNTTGEYERDPVIARVGNSLGTDRYLVGWKTSNDGVYWLSVIDGSGRFFKGPDAVSSAGIRWGDRDDSLRTRPDGTISWVQGAAGSATLRFFIFNGESFLP